jgi:DNA-binding GntR family transcriptional regulator
MPTRDDRGRDRDSEDDARPMTELFAEVKQESTRTKVYTALREAIISGKLRTGQKLTEIGLATTFKVSRSIIREALRELVRDGLVEQNAYKSTTVVRLTPEQVDEILTVRLLLESEAVRLAHARLSDADRARLRAMVDELEAAAATHERLASLDLAFHDHLWQLSGNRTLEGVLRQITSSLFAMGVIVRSAVAERKVVKEPVPLVDHRILVDAICDGTVDEAVAAVRSHVTYNWQRIKEHLAAFEQLEAMDRAGSKAADAKRKKS